MPEVTLSGLTRFINSLTVGDKKPSVVRLPEDQYATFNLRYRNCVGTPYAAQDFDEEHLLFRDVKVAIHSEGDADPVYRGEFD